jgi:hypothetical protein
VTPGGAAAGLEVYVWFESDPADDDAVVAAFDRLARAMADDGAIPLSDPPRLLRRPDLKERDGRFRATWMEVWPAVPGSELSAWIDRLDRLAVTTGASALAPAGRHVEPFEPRTRRATD